MSSTQMDLSPLVIDRKQDIASWPEGDIEQLATRDKNRYQKRKSAIIEYFQSDLSVEEISATHRLSAVDVLETMARRCCMLHEDGRPWGFRALVPGVRVVDTRSTLQVSSDMSENANTQIENEHAEPPVEQEELQTRQLAGSANGKADTGQHRVVGSNGFAVLPETPRPADEEQTAAVVVKTRMDFSDAFLTTSHDEVVVEEEVTQEEFPPLVSADTEAVNVPQKEFPPLTSEETQLETATVAVEEEQETGQLGDTKAVEDARTSEDEEAVRQEEFPGTTENTDLPAGEEEVPQEEFPVLMSEEEVPQEEFPSLASDDAEATLIKSKLGQEISPEVEEEVKQEEFPVLTSETETVVEEEVKQEEFPALENAVEVVVEEEVTQEEFPALVSETETVVEEEGRQEEFPARKGEVEEEETREESSVPTSETEKEEEEEVKQEEFPALTSAVVDAEKDEEEDFGDEPTGKLSVVRPALSKTEAQEEEKAGEEEDIEHLPTTALVAVQSTPTEEPQKAEQRDEEAEETLVAEMDTVEVAKVVVEERLNRVAATETIKVPAAMLEALEKADQALQAREQETTAAGDTQDEDKTLVASAPLEDHVATTLPAVSELAETHISSGQAQAGEDIAAEPTQSLDASKTKSDKLAQTELKSPTQSLVEDSRFRISGKQAAIKHAVRRRWGKQGRQQKYRRWVRIVSAAIVVTLLVILLIPLGVGLVGYNAYTNIKSVADDGVKNLLSLNDLLPKDHSDIMGALNAQKLATGKANLQKAQNDFLQLQDMVNRPDIKTLLQQFAPQYSDKLDMAQRLVQVALDVTRMGQELIGVGQMGATIMHSSGSLLSSNSTTPLLSADDINTIQAALVHAQYYIGDIQTQMSGVDMNQVPLGSAAEKAKLSGYLAQIPQIQDYISQAQTLIGPVAWLLGVGQTRHLLVQTLDRGELRPSGGFEGQYGLLTLQNGRMSPFSLRDVTLIDYAGNGNQIGATPPAGYSWMNFGNFGVRDANLSADFPTTAKIVMNYFQAEGGGPVDGVIQITPVIIEQFLDLTGPLVVKDYNNIKITSQNLENELHAFQQDPRLIQEQQEKTGSDAKSTRKAFTNLVGTLLMDRIKHLSPSQMMDFGKVLLKDLKSRDLQIYLNNPVAEQWLAQNQDDGAMPKYTNGMDGFMVVQANISISKAAQYVKSTFKDNVTLDASGGATHNLTISLDYQRHNRPIYGYEAYADYLRIYAPANARLISAYGFNTGSVLCTPGKTTTKPTNNKGKTTTTTTSSGGAAYTDAGVVVSGCGQYYHSFPDTGARSCPNGDYRLGYDGMVARPWAYQNLGGPTSKTSDLSGYAMWGGMTLTPQDCVSTISLSWYVPHIVQNKAGQSPYQMTVGHQAGWPVTAQVSIDASALKNIKDLKYKQTITVDTLVGLAPLPDPKQPQKPGSGTPTPAVTATSTPKKP